MHWNPVKHGLVDDPGQWKYSKFPIWISEEIDEYGWGINGIARNLSKLGFE
jgi:hypothetical protein